MKKSNIIIAVALALVGVVSFIFAFAIKSASIDDSIKSSHLSEEDVIEYDNSTIKEIKPTIDGVKYDSIQELVGVVSEPTVCEVEVTYKTSDEPATFNAYISFNSDESVKEATYTSGDYFQIILPSLKSSEKSVGSNSISSTEE